MCMGNKKGRALVVLSGGQDSTTCLFWAVQLFEQVYAVSFDYGQRHKIELESAAKVAAMAGVPHEIISVGNILAGTSPLTNHEQQVEHYKDAASLPGGIEKTFVPMRNTLFFTVAANRAVVLGCTHIITGVAQEDFGGYPDCREDFLKILNHAFNESLDGVTRLQIIAPLMHLNKQKTVQLAAQVPGALEALAYSHTCYEGHFPPCGTCHACLLRSKGFIEAGIEDPLVDRVRDLKAEPIPGAFDNLHDVYSK
jgi:7-cyano-7-deazaguanine synthase